MTIAFTNIGDASLGAGASLSTTYTNAAAGVVVATFSLYGVGGLANIASVTDSTGVTWQRRSRTTMSSAYQPSGITDMGQEVWWAYQPAINASAVTLTIAVANSSLNGLAVHCSQFLVTGSPTPATPWEPGAINTQAYSNGSTPATPNGTVTTAQANSVAFSSLSQMTASGTATDTAATGFTAINNLTTGSTVHFGESAVQKAITSPGTTTITWTGSQLAYLQVNDAFAGVSGVGATVAHVNSASFGGSGTSGTGTIAVTAGNILMLCVHVDSHTSGIPRTPVITDSQSNTWVQTVNSQSAQSGQVQTTDVYYCFPTSTGTLTITATVNTNNSWEAGVDQFSGVDKAFPFSDTPVTTTNYTTTPTAASSTQTVSRAGSYVMAYATTNVFPLTFANPSGFTAGGGSSTGSFASVKGAYIAEAAAGTQTIDYSNATTQTQWCVTSAVLQPPTAIALDGSAIGADSANQTSITATLTTTQTNDVIVVAVLLAGAVARTVSSVTASGLTFTKRSSTAFTNHGGNIFVDMEMWYAVAASPLTSKVITVTASGSVSGNFQVYAAGFSGANTSAPWDTNASLPSITTDTSGSFSGMTGTADSTSAGDRLGIVLGANDGSNTLSAGRVGNVSPSKAIANQSGVGIYISMLDYAPQAATVTSKTNTFSGGTATNWGILADFLAVPSTNTNTGSITTTLTKASIAGVGAMYPKGTIATNLTKASMSASGAMYPKGTISTALTKASMSAAGKVSPIGTIATVLQKVSQRLQGSGVNSGTVTTSLTKASFSLVGKASIKGTIVTALQPTSQSLSGKVSPTGKITTTLSHISQSVAATMAQGGTITTRLRSLSQSLSGSAPPAGTIVTRLPRLSQQATGWAEIIGAAVTDLAGSAVHMHAQTFEVFTGTIQMDLSGFLQNMQAREIFTGSIVTQLGPIAQDAAAEEIFTGTIYTKLGNANGSVIANVVEAAVIIQGPIEMNLGPLDVTALGALLGSPGAGKWYSWRQTDN